MGRRAALPPRTAPVQQWSTVCSPAVEEQKSAKAAPRSPSGLARASQPRRGSLKWVGPGRVSLDDCAAESTLEGSTGTERAALSSNQASNFFLLPARVRPSNSSSNESRSALGAKAARATIIQGEARFCGGRRARRRCAGDTGPKPAVKLIESEIHFHLPGLNSSQQLLCCPRQ